MNAVEIEQAISELAEKERFDPSTFPLEFLRAFGSKDTTVKRLKSGETNKSDVGGVLQVKHIHLAIAPAGEVSETLSRLRESPATSKHKVKFILATDGVTFEAEDLTSGETVACAYTEFPNHFGFFLPLAGITTVKQIRESSFDIRATSRLNRLYVKLLQDNPDWGSAARRHDMNHFMARLIFCFFAEDTDIFPRESRFTQTIEQMSARDSSNTHEVIQTLFLAMNTKTADRVAAGIPRWALGFPYVNGGLFSGSFDVPVFSKIARSYLVHIGNLDWTQINPDIFGSMIQAVAEDEERGELGMHYTSIPNILKVLNPLFLDDLRAKLEEAGNNKAKLLNLRKRMARIRVFDPACGSGNFLVIAYKEMRTIEAEINKRRGEADQRSVIPLTNFRGIELRDFAAEIARLALIIAEYQCDVLYRGPQLALAEFLPLEADNWITCGNALRIDWLSVCPQAGTAAKVIADDLFSTPLEQTEIDFENEGGETYICGNPPYVGSVLQSESQKADLQSIFAPFTTGWKSLDYVAGWIFKATQYGQNAMAASAFVATNSVCQGEQVPILWPLIFSSGHHISFAYRSFKWANLASNNAGVTVVIIGLANGAKSSATLYDFGVNGEASARTVGNIGPYLVSGPNVWVEAKTAVTEDRATMIRGNMPNDGGFLVLSPADAMELKASNPGSARFIRSFIGSKEFINSTRKYCLWIEDIELDKALQCPGIASRIAAVKKARLKGGKQARENASTPHRFVFAPHRDCAAIVLPRVSSENRDYLPAGVTDGSVVISERNFALYGAALWNLSILLSRLHWVWVGAISARLEMRLSYANTLCWNTFPIPVLTERNKAELTRCVEDILLAREHHFPLTIAELYDSESMPADLREAHSRNDEVLERIYIGRRFRNDTERLEKLFEMYTKMSAGKGSTASKKGRKVTS